MKKGWKLFLKHCEKNSGNPVTEIQMETELPLVSDSVIEHYQYRHL